MICKNCGLEMGYDTPSGIHTKGEQCRLLLQYRVKTLETELADIKRDRAKRESELEATITEYFNTRREAWLELERVKSELAQALKGYAAFKELHEPLVTACVNLKSELAQAREHKVMTRTMFDGLLFAANAVGTVEGKQAKEMLWDAIRPAAKQPAAPVQIIPECSYPGDAKEENGNYENVCQECHCHFIGLKGRFMCRMCADKVTQECEQPAAPDDFEKLVRKVALEGTIERDIDAPLVKDAIAAVLAAHAALQKEWDTLYTAYEKNEKELATHAATCKRMTREEAEGLVAGVESALQTAREEAGGVQSRDKAATDDYQRQRNGLIDALTRHALPLKGETVWLQRREGRWINNPTDERPKETELTKNYGITVHKAVIVEE